MTIGTKVKVARVANKLIAASPPERIQLRHTPTGQVSGFYAVDCREILAAPNTEYEPADADAKHALTEAKIRREDGDAVDSGSA